MRGMKFSRIVFYLICIGGHTLSDSCPKGLSSILMTKLQLPTFAGHATWLARGNTPSLLPQQKRDAASLHSITAKRRQKDGKKTAKRRQKDGRERIHLPDFPLTVICPCPQPVFHSPVRLSIWKMSQRLFHKKYAEN